MAMAPIITTILIQKVLLIKKHKITMPIIIMAMVPLQIITTIIIMGKIRMVIAIIIITIMTIIMMMTITKIQIVMKIAKAI